MLPARHAPVARCPINQLAAELLDEIMSDTLALHHDDWQTSVTARGGLALVCRHWNTRLYGQPRLWTDIILYAFTNPLFVDLCITNSKACPLTVTVQSNSHPIVVSRRLGSTAHTILECHIPTLIAVVLPKMSPGFDRIRDLSVTCDNSADLKPVMQELLKYPAPKLRRLHLRLPPRQTDQRHLLSQLEGQPSLTHVAFWSIQPPWLNAPAVYSNLSVLKLAYITRAGRLTWPELAGVISSAANTLTVLQLTEVRCREIDSARRVTLPRLTHFLFGYDDDGSVDTVSLLDMPLLRVLRLTVYGIEVSNFTARCQHILGRVQELDVSVDRRSEEYLARLLQAAPNTTRLSLSRCPFPVITTFVSSFPIRCAIDLPRLKRLLFSTVITREQVNIILGAAGNGCRLVGKKEADGSPTVEWVGPWQSPTELLYSKDGDPHCGWAFWYGDS
ncbi:hypothetical protein DFH09DRAFT_1311753 [Mycena vulgaris]|nr:hypothetical protein DFH09DRAFT_1311753 [Mycena vulgaris]